MVEPQPLTQTIKLPAPLTHKIDNARGPTYYRGCWHVVSSPLSGKLPLPSQCELLPILTLVLDLQQSLRSGKPSLSRGVALGQVAPLLGRRFPTAASR